MNRLAMVVVSTVYLPSWALAAGTVTVSVTAGPVTQHEPTRLAVEIANPTKHPVLLDSLRIGEAGAAYTWEEQVYGSLSYSQADDAFTHNQMAQMASQLKLGSAIVAPGATAHHTLPLTLDESGPVELVVVLSYSAIDSDTLAAHIYLPRSTSALEEEYRPATFSELAEVGTPGSVGGLPLHLVARDLPRPRQVKTRIAVTVKEAEFPLEEAMRRVSVTSHEYDAQSRTWLLDTTSGLWLVTPEGAEFLPGLGAKEHRFVAESGGTVPFWFLLESLPEGLQPAVRERIARYEPEEAMGVRFDVPAGDVPGVAAELAKQGLRVELADFQLTPMLAIRPIDE